MNRKHPCVWPSACGRGPCLFRLLAAACLAAVLCGCASVDVLSMLRPNLREVTLQRPTRGRFTTNRILLLDVGGIISSRPPGVFSLINRCDPDTVKAVLTKAERDPRVRAVVVRIDTPGGGVSPTDTIYHELQEFRRRTGRPVLAAIMGIGCSGGYYIAAAADRIYATPSAVTGSIGVIATFPRVQGLADKVGFEQTVIKSGKMKDLGNPLRDMPDEERVVLQEMIDHFFGRFQDVVVAGRDAFSSPSDLGEAADGRILTAQQALNLKLVDRIAYIGTVIEDAKRDAGIRDARVVTYCYADNPDATIYTKGAAQLPKLNLLNLDLTSILGQGKPGFHYLWLPGVE